MQLKLPVVQEHLSWFYISLSTILHYNFCAIMATEDGHISEAVSGETSTTSTNLLRMLCASQRGCRNGDCYVIGQTPQCNCGSLFWGDKCEFVNLKAANQVTIGSIVILQWPRPPRLEGYAFVYYRLDSPDRILYKNRITMKDNDMSLLVGKLDRQNTEYRVCLEDDFMADLALRTNAVDFLSNCIVVKTEPDYHTLAAYIIAVLLCCVVVILIYYQRDKLELLFFSKPLMIYSKPKEDEEESEERTTSTP